MSDKTFDEDQEAGSGKSKKEKRIPLSVPIPVGIRIDIQTLNSQAINFRVSKVNTVFGKLEVYFFVYDSNFANTVFFETQLYPPYVGANFQILNSTFTYSLPSGKLLAIVVVETDAAGNKHSGSFTVTTPTVTTP